MAVSTLEHELEALSHEVLPELGASSGESYETEWEGEGESEQFFGALKNLASKGAGWITKAGSPQRRFALWAAKKALTQGLPAVGRVAGNKIGGSQNGATGAKLGKQAGSWLSDQLPQQEWEGEGELNPVRKWYPDAMFEHLGHAAAETENEAEADALAGAMIPLIANLIAQSAPPAATQAITRATPGLACGLAGVTRALRHGPGTKPLVRVVPAIARRAATSIARQAASGAPVSPQAAVRTLATETARMLGNPRQAAQAFRRSQQLDRHYHGVAPTAKKKCGNCAKCRSLEF